MENEMRWVGFEVDTSEARWVCVKCIVPPSADGDRIEYVMEFEARGPRGDGVPATRQLRLRTSLFKVDCEPGFFGFLELVVQGQLIETNPWDRIKEAYERD
jgi:hypothetical protein